MEKCSLLLCHPLLSLFVLLPPWTNPHIKTRIWGFLPSPAPLWNTIWNKIGIMAAPFTQPVQFHAFLPSTWLGFNRILNSFLPPLSPASIHRLHITTTSTSLFTFLTFFFLLCLLWNFGRREKYTSVYAGRVKVVGIMLRKRGGREEIEIFRNEWTARLWGRLRIKVNSSQTATQPFHHHFINMMGRRRIRRTREANKKGMFPVKMESV